MAPFEVRRLRADEWRELRELRLEALRDAPQAFSTPLGEATARPDGRWRDDARRGTSDASPVFVAEAGGTLVGMASGWDGEHGAELFQMFVRAEARGAGVGAALVEAVAAWASGRGRRRLELRVADDNDAAERLYLRCGFDRTGEVLARAEGNVGREVRMAREL